MKQFTFKISVYAWSNGVNRNKINDYIWLHSEIYTHAFINTNYLIEYTNKLYPLFHPLDNYIPTFNPPLYSNFVFASKSIGHKRLI
jgi:hypothetical protein